MIGRLIDLANNRHRIFSIFRGRGQAPTGAQPLTFEGEWEAEQAPFRGCGGANWKGRLFVRVKKCKITLINVYFSFVWGAAPYLCSQNKNYMGQKEDIEKTENKIIFIREQRVILDRDVAELYGVETRRINEALKNNPEKFPDGYVIELTDKEKQYVVENFDHLEKLKYSHVPTKAFTEKGLYMLATILKSPLATEVTIAIVETFAKLRQVARAIGKVNADAANGIVPEEAEQGRIQNLMGEVLSDTLPLKMRKLAFSLNLGFVKVSIETTRERKD